MSDVRECKHCGWKIIRCLFKIPCSAKGWVHVIDAEHVCTENDWATVAEPKGKGKTK